MSWKERPPPEAYAESVLLPAIVSLLGGIVAFGFVPLALLTGSLAWWCWWKCRADAAVNGLGVTIAALIINHAAALFWLLVAGEYFLGGFGVALAMLIAIVYAFVCTALIGSAAWKYFLSFACFCVAISSLLWSSIFNAREDARVNSLMNHLRQLGAASQRTDPHEKTEPDSSPLSERWEQP